jgi:DNA-binding GntR family transcriptional regulator
MPADGADVLRKVPVDRNSPVPLYFQVASYLEDAIVTGSLVSGALLPNEIQLAHDLGLSRPTMRMAMQHLVDKGLVVRRRGVGTRVVQPKVRRRMELSSLYEDLQASGQSPSTEVLAMERVEVDAEVAERLGLQDGATAFRLDRLRSAGGRPLARMTNYLPERFVSFEADDLAEHGLYELLRSRGVVLHSATQTIGARPATPKEARGLDEPKGAALLTMQRVSFDDRGDVVEYGTHLYAASRYSFEVSLLGS